jgi:putative PIN family toxin of toxin-antitoxin system
MGRSEALSFASKAMSLRLPYSIAGDIIPRMRLVLDTNVLLAGLRSKRGASYWLLERLLEETVEAAASAPVLLEYEAVLTRPKKVAEIGWSKSEMQTFLETLAALVVPTDVWFLWRPGFAAMTDEMFVEGAVASSADILVTFNTRDYFVASRQFTFEIKTPGQTMNLLKQAGIS